MCGIIGYFGRRDAAPLLLQGLKNLEYRGYDSCGIATFFNNEILLKKEIGKVEEVDEKQKLSTIAGNMGIAHTRWATHGKVTRENAHPHLSNNKKIAVVHNGIIENYSELKNFLIKEGFFFKSETDTEIIPNLIEHYIKLGNNFINASIHTFNRLEGQYAIVAINDEEKVVAVRKEAPLVIGIGDMDNHFNRVTTEKGFSIYPFPKTCDTINRKVYNEFFLASDVIAFLKQTKKVIFLEERDMVILENLKEGFKIFNLNNNSFVYRNISYIDWNEEQVQKGNFNHFFMKEVVEQAQVIEKIAAIDKKVIRNIADEIKNAEDVYIIACGSAFYAGLCGVYMFSKIASKKVNFCLASEFNDFKCFINKNSLIIAISQSGETADTLSAIREAKSCGAKIIAICNSSNSSLTKESNDTIFQCAGREICVLSTKSYTSQIAILGLLAHELENRLDESIEKLKELVRGIYYLTSDNVKKFIKVLSEKLKNKENIYVIGRGLQYSTALEAALKIKESSYIHAEAFACGELKHGSIALISEGTPCIVFFSEENEKETLNNVMEIKARGAYVVGIGPKNNKAFDFFIKVADAEDFNSILQIIPIQILSYQLALLRGCDPDKPRNLAKSVVVK